MARAPKALGKYRLRRRIADGQFAVVYEAYDTIEGQTVALKVPVDQAPERREDAYREVRLMVALQHPNILPIKSATIEDGKFVIAYRLGKEALDERLQRRLAHRTALSIAEDLLEAVDYAHQHRVIHRDIKPENVILFEDESACLADFGIAKMARKTQTASYDGTGTYGYMAPEQALGKPTLRSDVFSLGLVLWRILGGVLPEWPFSWPLQGHERIRKIYGAELVEVLKKALIVDDRKRYPNAGSMNNAFRQAKRHSPVLKKEAVAPAAANPRSSWRDTRSREFRRSVRKKAGQMGQCEHCQGPVAEAMNFCPWCRQKITTYTGPTDFSDRCTRCQRGVKPDWTYCAWCYGPKLREPVEKFRSDKRYVRRCASPRCGERLLLPFSRYCPACRARVQKPWSGFEGAKPCRHCGSAVFPNNWDNCPWCGKNCASRKK